MNVSMNELTNVLSLQHTRFYIRKRRAFKCLRTFSDLFSPTIIDQSSCRILTTHAKNTPILHDDWSIRLGENRPDRALTHLAVMLSESGLYESSTRLLKMLRKFNTGFLRLKTVDKLIHT